MQKVILSALLSLLVGAGIVVAIQVRNAGETQRTVGELSRDVAALREDLAGIRGAIEGVGGQLRRTEISWETAAGSLASTAASAGADGAVPVAALAADSQRLKTAIMSAIAEERQLREAEAQREREEMRQRAEERRQEFASLNEGPYDRYNLKVNSLAKVLNMTEGQKAAYVELAKGYNQKSDEARAQLRGNRGEAGGEGQAAEGGGRGGRGRGDPQQFQQFRELSQNLQTEFATQLESVLTGSQLLTYAELSEGARSFQNMGYVAAPGEEAQGNRFLGGVGLGGDRGGAAARGMPGQLGGQAGGQRGGRGGGR